MRPETPSTSTDLRDYLEAAADRLTLGSRILTEFARPPADHTAINRRLSALQRASEDLLSRFTTVVTGPDTATPTRDLYRLARSLDTAMNHLAAAATRADSFEMATLPTELLELIDLVAEAGQRTAQVLHDNAGQDSLSNHRHQLGVIADAADTTYRRLFTRWLLHGVGDQEATHCRAVGDELEYAIHALEVVAHDLAQIAETHGGRIPR